MIFEINPIYDEVLILDLENDVPIYYTLYVKRRDVTMQNIEISEDDCLIAYSNKSKEEITDHRNKLVTGGYYKALDLYTRQVPNFLYKKITIIENIYQRNFN